jgi:predicted acylesterase/phospholipase RssA
MSKRLAITISGAVSLGSYEAGVLYEICEALGQHNDPETRANPVDRIEIDVLTGASAGGMTAVIAAQNLLYSGSSLKEPQNNPFLQSLGRRSSLCEIRWKIRRVAHHSGELKCFRSDGCCSRPEVRSFMIRTWENIFIFVQILKHGRNF